MPHATAAINSAPGPASSANGEHDALRRLLEYTIRMHYPDRTPGEFFEELCTRTARLMADWMRLGFVHGVMNTDNLSILGLTIDYGPYGWLEGYDPQWTPNTTDAERRRYRFGQQPAIVGWNVARLADAFYPLAREVPPLEGVGERYKSE